MRVWVMLARFKRMNPYHEFGEKHLNTFFYDGFDDQTKALFDASVGGQLSEVPQN